MHARGDEIWQNAACVLVALIKRLYHATVPDAPDAPVALFSHASSI